MSAPTHSATMAPITQEAVAILRAEKRNGSEDGRRSLKKTWRRLAERTRISSSAEGSTASRPRTMLTRVGKNEINAAITTFGA